MNTNFIGFFALIILIISGGCNQKKESELDHPGNQPAVTIQGFLKGGAGLPVFLEEMAAREFIPVDTSLCDETGAFDLKVNNELISFYVLRYGPSGYITLLLEPGESLSIMGDFNDIESYEIKGSQGSVLLRTLAIKHRAVLEELGDIARKNMEAVSSPDYAEVKASLDIKFDSISNAFRKYSLEFIHHNSGSLAILVALYNLYGQGLPVFSPEEDFQVYQFVDSALMANYEGFEAVDLLHAQVMEAKIAMNNDRQRIMIQKGEIAPDFVSSRPDGSELALSDLKGNYVLLSFWAGWSYISRDENALLKKVQNLYGSKNFRILQVSFDDHRETWTDAIRDDGLEWDHVSDLNRWETPVADLYHIEKIPSNVLVDPSGRVAETDLFGDKLLERLEYIFSE